MKYGYLPASDPSTGQLQAWTSVTNAVRAMQRFAGLNDTGVVGEGYSCEKLCALLRDPTNWCLGYSLLDLLGVLCDILSLLWFFCAVACLDEETMALMRSPRCSLPDQDEPSKSLANQERRNMKRRRRAISMWTRRNINWRLDFIIQFIWLIRSDWSDLIQFTRL